MLKERLLPSVVPTSPNPERNPSTLNLPQTSNTLGEFIEFFSPLFRNRQDFIRGAMKAHYLLQEMGYAGTITPDTVREFVAETQHAVYATRRPTFMEALQEKKGLEYFSGARQDSSSQPTHLDHTITFATPDEKTGYQIVKRLEEMQSRHDSMGHTTPIGMRMEHKKEIPHNSSSIDTTS